MSSNSNINKPIAKSPLRRIELWLAASFVLVHLVAPFLVGEVYPFTISPMFCDQPDKYCLYEIEDANGESIDPEVLGLHLVYDGNPVGLGVGIQPKPTLHGFGEVPDAAVVREHVEKMLRELPYQQVVVTQTTVSCQNHTPVEEKVSWTIRKRGNN